MSALANWVASGRSSPIIYLKLDDPTQPGKNMGTGGDFALTGVVARSGRGPNQFNAPYSDLDGTADYLSCVPVSGIASSKVFTASFVINADVLNKRAVTFMTSGSVARFLVDCPANASFISVKGYSSSNVLILDFNASSPVFSLGRNYVVTLSIDLSDAGKRHVIVNGTPASTINWNTYTNTDIDFSGGNRCRVGLDQNGTIYFNGRLGNVFFDTKYIDLSVPTNLAKFVTGTGIDAKPVGLGANGELPFGTPPLIYLPMYGNNAGKNYGTGGDFTVNSGPFPGARGPNEFWGNKADFDGSSGRLNRTTPLLSAVEGREFSCSFKIQYDGSSPSVQTIYRVRNSATAVGLQISINSNKLSIVGGNFSGEYTTLTVGASYYVQMSVNRTPGNDIRRVYVDGILASETIISNSTAIDFGHTGDQLYIGESFGQYFNGKLLEFYFTTDYIDFSQEANRLKFRDAFGNPVDLTPQIEAGTLPKPAIYMRFDPANFGKNSGTGGDFTVNGTITDGGQL